MINDVRIFNAHFIGLSLLNERIVNLFDAVTLLAEPKQTTSILFFFNKYCTNFFDLITSPEYRSEKGSRTEMNNIFFNIF